MGSNPTSSAITYINSGVFTSNREDPFTVLKCRTLQELIELLEDQTSRIKEKLDYWLADVVVAKPFNLSS